MPGAPGTHVVSVAPGWRVRTSDGVDVGHVVSVLASHAGNGACLVLALERAARLDDARVVVGPREITTGDGVVTLTRVAHGAFATTGWMRAATYGEERAPSRVDGERPATAPLPCARGENGHD